MGDRAVRDSIRRLAGTFSADAVSFLSCAVDSVDINSRTCDCTQIGGDAVIEVPGVQLMTEVDDGWLLIPAIGSTVIVCYSSRNIPYIALFSEIDKAFLITANGIQLQGGEFGGLIKVEELTEKLNNLENAFNDLVEKYNTHTHILTLTSGTGTAAPTATSEAGVLTPTERAEIENTSVTHGS